MSASSSPRRGSQSPRRSPQSSPKRRPLHERTESQTNITSPTIRIVEEPDPRIYSKSPYPVHPSQILTPHHAPGFWAADRDGGVSDENASANATPKSQADPALIPQPLRPHKADRVSNSTTTSETETLSDGSPFSPSSSRFSQSTSPPSTSAGPDDDRVGGRLSTHNPVHSNNKESSIRTIASPGANGHETLTSRPSEPLLTSSSSSDTLTPPKQEDQTPGSSSSGNYYLYSSPPHNTPGSPTGTRRSKQASAAKRRSGESAEAFSTKPAAGESAESIATSDASHTSSERPRSATTPTVPSHAALQRAIDGGVKIQYPVVRPPSASGSWAESAGPSPQTAPRMNFDHPPVKGHQWSSQLSTIHSESERGSISVFSTTESSSGNGTRRSGQRRRTISSPSNDDIPTSSSAGSIPVPPPLFETARTRELRSRDSDERDDIVGELPTSPPLRHQRSGYLPRWPQSMRPSSSSSDAASDNGSFISVVGDSLPSWARTFYRRYSDSGQFPIMESTTDLASNSSRLNTLTSDSAPTMSPIEENFPQNLFNPRKRGREGRKKGKQAQGEDDRPATRDSEGPFIIPPPRNIRPDIITPHLHLNRRSTMALSTWRAPSFDEPLGNLFFSPVNRQIFLFCLGFIFPPAWLIAGLLPLPPDPSLMIESESQMEVGRTMQHEVGPIDLKRYLKARWWRTLNRIMSVVGVLLIGAIVALTVLTFTKYR